jgi:hypothetical protein
MSRKAVQISRLPTPLTEPVVTPVESEAALADAGEVQVIEADVDGRRVRIVAKDEIVLECGQASVTLRRNGRIIIRGTYVETHSEGTNRIKGGQVRIN